MASRPAVTVLLGDPSLPDASKPGNRYNPEDFDAIARMKAALEGENAFDLSYIDRHEGLPALFLENPPEFVLNLCDVGYRNKSRLELHVVALMEMLDIPYSGNSPATITLCNDKSLIHGAARDVGVPVPEQRFWPSADAVDDFDLPYPVIVKPNRTHGSLGITKDAVVHDEAQARAYLDMLAEMLPGHPVLMQEYLSGAEYSVGIIGNSGDDYFCLPPVEVDYSGLPEGLSPILSYESKTVPDSPYWTDIRYHEANISGAQRARLNEQAIAMFERLGCQDYARCDFRSAADGTIKLLEMNPNPAWSYDGKLAMMAGFAGMRYGEMLVRIVDVARRRSGLA
ncbi:MAG: ATP-grasp domain-containing protein [Alphaproteobacteria bacterium]|nr:ATP-grasp domain-containing protein [Alphaproteobacteria bacterium]